MRNINLRILLLDPLSNLITLTSVAQLMNFEWGNSKKKKAEGCVSFFQISLMSNYL